MKRFSTILFLTLIVTGLSAQEVKVSELWNHSAMANKVTDPLTGNQSEGDAPDWMGDVTERRMMTFGDRVYVASRKVNKILVFDLYTGTLLADEVIDLDMDVITGSFYKFNDLGFTSTGDLVLGSMTLNIATTEYKVYLMKANGSGGFDAPENIITYTAPAEDPEVKLRVGDGFGVYGDIADGDGYIITGSNDVPARVYRWNVNDGVVNQTPSVFGIQTVYPAPAPGADPKIGINPKFWPVNDNLVWIDGKTIFPGLYDMDGNLVSGFSGDSRPYSDISGVCYFNFKGRDFVWCPNSNHAFPSDAPKAAFELFEAPATGWGDAVSHGTYPTEGLGTKTNSSYAAPVSCEVKADKVIMVCMSPKNGLAAYEMIISSATAIGDKEESTVDMYPNPATDVVNFTEEMTEVEVLDMAGKLVKRAYNTKQVNISALKGLYMVRATDKQGASMVKKLIVR
ncbi:MAG: T9SS type A sorting domain-containing protein [Carboxylicivirga sp.]|nr:T9SS type A sorting domain-containing protein [Carboxylicivirga sp.]